MMGMRCRLAKNGHSLAEDFAHPLDQGWRSDGLIAMLTEKGHHLTAHLQRGNVGVQVNAVQAFEVQHHVPIEHLVDVANPCHLAYPRQNSPMPSLHFTIETERGARRSEAGLISSLMKFVHLDLLRLFR